MAVFHQFVQSAFYALAYGLAMFSVYSWLAAAVSLCAGAACGALSGRVALGYEAALGADAAINTLTCLRIVRASISSSGWTLRDAVAAGLGLAMGALCLFTQGVVAGSAAALACAILFLLARIDTRARLLPDALTAPLLGLGIWIGPLSAQAAIFAALLTYGLGRVSAALYQRIRGHAGMGGGDLKLMAALAAWMGGTALVWVVMGASVLGVLCAMGAQRRWLPRGAYPFGPFLALSATPVLVAGAAVQSWF
jgi:leader peptidase (prepilin peptidase)/N-methyltransferase